MNKNIITMGCLLISSSVISASEGFVSSPNIEFYRDGLRVKVNSNYPKPFLSQRSNISNSVNSLYHFFTSAENDVSIQSVLYSEQEDVDILEKLEKIMEASKPLPSEFSKVIDDDFWDLF